VTTTHAVYCESTCTPDEYGRCQTTTVWGDENSTDDAGTFTTVETYVPDTAVYVNVTADLYEVSHVDALIAHLLEVRNHIEKQEDSGH
jgi:hypothetical protein